MYLVGFDFDGVIINSKPTMERAWQDINKKFCLGNKYPFTEYLKHVGKPFQVIMELMDLEDYLPNIMKYYFERTSVYSNLIQLYPGIKEVLFFCNQSSMLKTALITSKCKYRTREIINKMDLIFDMVITPEDTLRGKPFPDPLFYANKLSKIAATNSVYIGDMHSDFYAAKSAGWSYLHAKWGYGDELTNYKYNSNVEETPDIINRINQYFHL